MSAKAGKRPMRALSAQEKLEAIRRVHDGESKASVARDIGVPESTLRGWCKNETKISFQCSAASPDSVKSNPEKRPRLEESAFNLSLRTSTSPVATNGGAVDFSMRHKESNNNLQELASMSRDLGLNRPEANGYNSRLALGNLLLQQQTQQLLANNNKENNGLLATVKSDDLIATFIRYQQLLQQQPTEMGPSYTAWMCEVYKLSQRFQNAQRLLQEQQQPPQQPTAPVTPPQILYDQLTRPTRSSLPASWPPSVVSSENSSEGEQSTSRGAEERRESTLHNLLDTYRRPYEHVNGQRVNGELIGETEALEHGEQFLRWLEGSRHPSVTATHIIQLRTLLGNIRCGTKGNGAVPLIAREKRKRK